MGNLIVIDQIGFLLCHRVDAHGVSDIKGDGIATGQDRDRQSHVGG